MSRWHRPKGWRERLARRLSFLADRIDPKGAPRAIGWAFTIEDRRGQVWRDGTTQGCPVWYLGEDDYERAFTEADHKAMRVDWATMQIVQRPDGRPGPKPHVDQQEVNLGPHPVDVRAPGGPWTRHGHTVDGITVDGPGRPPVARCGGPALCHTCATDDARIRAAAHYAGNPIGTAEPDGAGGYVIRGRVEPIGTEKGSRP